MRAALVLGQQCRAHGYVLVRQAGDSFGLRHHGDDRLLLNAATLEEVRDYLGLRTRSARLRFATNLLAHDPLPPSY